MTVDISLNSRPSVSAAIAHRMNYLIERQSVVSGNIANAATPGYLSRDLVFAKDLQKLTGNVAVTNEKHLKGNGQALNGEIVYNHKNIQHNGNSVTMDMEMLKLNEIQMNYRLMTQLYAKHASMQRMAMGARQ